MPKVICIIGKICSGKTTYAKSLPGVLLSVDDFMLPLFGQNCELIQANLNTVQDCLMKLALDILASGVDVIFDQGYWSRAERERVAAFFRKHKIEVQWHYVNIPQELRKQRIEQRNAAIQAGLLKAYYVSPGLFAKCDELFEEPEELEIYAVK